MVRRPLRPSFDYNDKLRLLKDMETVRDLAIRYKSSAGYGTRDYELASDVQRAIDALATALTGDPTYYHTKPHGGGCG